jgi:hypothetical protein
MLLNAAPALPYRLDAAGGNRVALLAPAAERLEQVEGRTKLANGNFGPRSLYDHQFSLPASSSKMPPAHPG